MAGFFEKRNYKDLLAEVLQLYPGGARFLWVLDSEYEPGYLMLRLMVNDRVLLDLTQFAGRWTVFIVENSQQGFPATPVLERGKLVLPISVGHPVKRTAAVFVEFIGENWQLLSNLRQEFIDGAATVLAKESSVALPSATEESEAESVQVSVQMLDLYNQMRQVGLGDLWDFRTEFETAVIACEIQDVKFVFALIQHEQTFMLCARPRELEAVEPEDWEISKGFGASVTEIYQPTDEIIMKLISCLRAVSLIEDYELTFRGAANWVAAESFRALGYQGVALETWVELQETLPIEAMTGVLFSPMMSKLYEKHSEAQMLDETELESRIAKMIGALQDAK